MSGFRRPEVPREQLVLWSHRLEDALPADHPVRHVDWLLRSRAFAATFGEWEQQYVLVEGKPPYHPRDLAGLYLYGMMNRIRSSRQLERACWNQLDVIWLMSGQHPDHSTIADFVAKHGSRLRKLFKDVVQVGRMAGLVKLEHVSVDGTKVEADASKGSVHREATIAEELNRIEAQIAVLEAEWRANESREGQLWGDQAGWSPAPAASDRQRQAALARQREKLEAALKQIEARQQAAQSAIQRIASVTAPSSRVMPDKEGRRKPNYNAQLAVDAAESFIVGQEVNDEPEDSGQLVPLVEQVEEVCGSLPQEASADSQYNTGADLAEMERLGVTTFLPDSNCRVVPADDEPAGEALRAARNGDVLTEAQWEALPRTRKLISGSAFTYDPVRDSYRCPMGYRLEFLRTSSNETKQGRVHKKQYGGCSACATCPKATLCCKDPAKGRTVTRDEYEPCRERLRARMGGEHGRNRYGLRRQLVEPRFGHIKHAMGLRRFLRRGFDGVRTEWAAMCAAVNIQILVRCWDQVAPVLG